LVRTGKYVSGDEDKFEDKSDFVYASFADAIDDLLK
jgi:hypothetical protein